MADVNRDLDPAVVREIESLEAFAWLSPDAETESLTGDTIAWIEERANEFHGLLGAWTYSVKEFPPTRVETTRSAVEACARWRSAWEDPDLGRTPLWLAHLRWSRALGAALHSLPSWFEALQAVRGGLQPSLEALDRQNPSLSPSMPLIAPAVACAVLRHLWRLSPQGQASPQTPFCPLLDCWKRGLWPMWLPDGTLLVWVPTRRQGRVVVVPENESLAGPPSTPGLTMEISSVPPGRGNHLLSLGPVESRVDVIDPSTTEVTVGSAYSNMIQLTDTESQRLRLRLRASGDEWAWEREVIEPWANPIGSGSVPLMTGDVAALGRSALWWCASRWSP